MRTFTDTSIFQNVKEFSNEHGVAFRAMNEGGTTWGIYKKMNNAFIRITTLHCSEKALMNLCKATYKDTHQ